MEYFKAFTSWLEDMDGYSESERGRLFTALLEYAASGEKKEPRGTERLLYHKLVKRIDAQNAQDCTIYINNSNDTLSQVSDNGTSNLNSYLEQSFKRFWDSYPSKYRVNRKRCLELWKKIKPSDALVDKMIESIEAWKKGRQWQEGYVPNPDTWLRNEKWNDAKPDPWTANRNAALNYKQSPIAQDDFDAMMVNLSELRLD